MKITGPGKTSGPKGASKTGGKKKTGDSSFDTMVGGTEGASGAAPASSVMSIQGIDALLAVQGDGGGGAGHQKARRRAEDFLEDLEKIRMGLLSGGVPMSTLKHLAQRINTQRENIMDPHLVEILDEIELRVQVELAKYGQI